MGSKVLKPVFLRNIQIEGQELFFSLFKNCCGLVRFFHPLASSQASPTPPSVSPAKREPSAAPRARRRASPALVTPTLVTAPAPAPPATPPLSTQVRSFSVVQPLTPTVGPTELLSATVVKHQQSPCLRRRICCVRGQTAVFQEGLFPDPHRLRSGGEGEAKTEARDLRAPATAPFRLLSAPLHHAAPPCLCRRRSCISGLSPRYVWRVLVELSRCLRVESENPAPHATLVSTTMTPPPAPPALLGPFPMGQNVPRTRISHTTALSLHFG